MITVVAPTCPVPKTGGQFTNMAHKKIVHLQSGQVIFTAGAGERVARGRLQQQPGCLCLGSVAKALVKKVIEIS